MKCLILLTLVTACLINVTNAVEFKDYDEDDYEESEETYEKSRYKYFSEPREQDYAKKDSKKYYKDYDEEKEADYGVEDTIEKEREVNYEKKDDIKYYKDYNQRKESNYGIDLPKISTEEKAREENYFSNNDRRQAERAKEPQNKPISNIPRYDLKDAKNLFTKFIQDYNKKYKDQQDYNKHYENFVKNLLEINRMNQEGGDASFDINMFADQGDDEVVDDGGFQ